MPLGPGRNLLPRVHARLICNAMPEAPFFSAASYMEPLDAGLTVSDTELAAIAAGIAVLDEAGLNMRAGAMLQSSTISRFAKADRQDPRADAEALHDVAELERRLPQVLEGARWSGIPRSVCHGDLHTGNIGHRDGDPTRPVVFDW